MGAHPPSTQLTVYLVEKIVVVVFCAKGLFSDFNGVSRKVYSKLFFRFSFSVAALVDLMMTRIGPK